jgi:hypothetical protein
MSHRIYLMPKNTTHHAIVFIYRFYTAINKDYKSAQVPVLLNFKQC